MAGAEHVPTFSSLSEIYGSDLGKQICVRHVFLRDGLIRGSKGKI